MGELSQREIAQAFLMLVASGRVREAYDKYVSPEFRHHNPFFAGDRESLMLAMEENAVENPEKKLEIKLTLEDGDLVTTYSHVRQKPEDIGVAVVHIFRFVDDLIVELWDVGQQIPKKSTNENGVF